MNSVEMLGDILKSDEMQNYKGIGGLSFPFILEDGRAAVYLYIESDEKDAIELVGMFIRESGKLLFEETEWKPGQEEIDWLEENIVYGDRIPDEKAGKKAYLDALEELYAGFDSFAPDAFKEIYDLTSSQIHSLIVYIERITQFSSSLKRACYLHCASRFFQWCFTVCYAGILAE